MIALGSIATILCAALLFPALEKVIARKSFLVASALLAGITGIFAFNGHRALENTWNESYAWVPQLGLSFSVHIDALSYFMALSALAIGALVMLFSYWYFDHEEKPLGALGAELLAFAGAMVGLLVSDNLILFSIFWETTTVLSYLLIGFEARQSMARRAAMKSMMITATGGLILLAGLLLLGQGGGSYSMQHLLEAKPHNTDIAIAAWCIAVGAITKSALFPMHFWLPAAMQAPTPVSAYLHAAAMVNAGVYILCRTSPLFSSIHFWTSSLCILGLFTMVFAGYQALRHYDLKLVLAYSTVSQLGFLASLAVLGNAPGIIAFIAVFLAHSLFKASLFMWTGTVDHIFGTRNLKEMGELKQRYPFFYWLGVVNALSMAALFPLFGFISKEAGFTALLESGSGLEKIFIVVLCVVGSSLTFGYSLRFIYGISGGFATSSLRGAQLKWGIQVPPILLTVCTLVLTLFPSFISKSTEQFLHQFSGHAEKLSWFHGLSTPLLMTLAGYLGGSLIFKYRQQFRQFQKQHNLPISAPVIYQKSIRALENTADALTAVTQRGSLPFYISIIVGVFAGLPGALYLLNVKGQKLFGPKAVFVWANNGIEFLVAAVIIASAILTLFAKKRFSAIIFVSLSGYGLALMFSIHGAPDVALTQVAVETATLITFVLALRLFPARLWDELTRGHVRTRIIISVFFSCAMGFYAIMSLASRNVDPVSNNFFKLAYEQGGGKNVVNVTLVDIRGWDTFGEISVLVAAATGVASLIFVKHRERRFERVEEVNSGSIDRTAEFVSGSGSRIRQVAKMFNGKATRRWLPAAETLSPERRSIIFEIVVRIIFHTLIVISVFFLLSGHDQPGGGFAGGLVAGVACAIRYLAGGRYELTEAVPIQTGYFLGLGLFLAGATVVTPIFFGEPVFSSVIWQWDWPLIGHVKFVSATIFDVGVYLIVLGLILDVLRSLGSEIDSHAQDEDVVIGYETTQKKEVGV
ncbi:MAG: Na+/H+ antiporter subunit A [Micrococcaceae bacterium]